MAIFHKTLQYHEDTTEKRDISQEDIEFLKKLQLEMNTQDTTGTADPRFWVIKGSERVINNEDPDELCLQVDACGLENKMNEDARCRPDWCPLIPFPERHIAPKTATGYEIGYEDGWNECLEKMMRGAKRKDGF